MFASVIVGVDGRPAGRDAIALARQLADPGGRITLGTINELTVAWAYGYALGGGRNEPRATLERERAATGVEAELATVAASSVAHGLHHLVATRGADLLVVGSSRRGPVGRVLLGNDTTAVLGDAPCAVAVAPAGYRDDAAPIESIGVGFDGSPGAHAALAAARALGARFGAAVHALDVIPLPSASAFGGDGGGLALDDLVTAARERIAALDGVDGDVVVGVPALELATFGERVDLLVVGADAGGHVRRVLGPDVPDHLARHPCCPLLVLPGAQRARRSQPTAIPVARATA